MTKDDMQKFGALSEEQKQQIIAGTRAVKSRDEMRRCVDALVSDKQ